MLHARGALIGIVAFLGVFIGAVLAVVYLGFAPMAADDAPAPIEAMLAMKAVHAVSEREMGDLKDPLRITPENLTAGLTTYRQNCIMCHGAADGKSSNVAAGFYIAAPQFANDGAEDDPEGATYWKIHHGIRFTAMPAFHRSLTDSQIWQVAMFLKHMDRLPQHVDQQWKTLKSVGSQMDMSTKPKMDMK